MLSSLYSDSARDERLSAETLDVSWYSRRLSDYFHLVFIDGCFDRIWQQCNNWRTSVTPNGSIFMELNM